MNIREEFEQAKREYEIAVLQEQNAAHDFIDIAIKRTNAARMKLESIIQRAKKMGYTANAFECNARTSRRQYV